MQSKEEDGQDVPTNESGHIINCRSRGERRCGKAFLWERTWNRSSLCWSGTSKMDSASPPRRKEPPSGPSVPACTWSWWSTARLRDGQAGGDAVERGGTLGQNSARWSGKLHQTIKATRDPPSDFPRTHREVPSKQQRVIHRSPQRTGAEFQLFKQTTYAPLPVGNSCIFVDLSPLVLRGIDQNPHEEDFTLDTRDHFSCKKKERHGSGGVGVHVGGVKKEKNSLVCSIPKKKASNDFGRDMKVDRGGGLETIALKIQLRPPSQ